jgi:hypothetical protein
MLNNGGFVSVCNVSVRYGTDPWSIHPWLFVKSWADLCDHERDSLSSDLALESVLVCSVSVCAANTPSIRQKVHIYPQTTQQTEILYSPLPLSHTRSHSTCVAGGGGGEASFGLEFVTVDLVVESWRFCRLFTSRPHSTPLPPPPPYRYILVFRAKI